MKSYAGFLNMNVEPKNELNPVFWNPDKTLRESVAQALVDRASDFVKRLGKNPSEIEDVMIVGGNASYRYDDSSDLDVTILLDRNTKYSTEEIRLLGLSASGLTYRLSPSINGVDLNFYISSRNIGALRPAKQGIYSVFEERWIKPPTSNYEIHHNYITSKVNYFAELIEECINDDSTESQDCAKKLLERLKRYRISGLKSSDGENSTPNLVWRVLSTSNYINTLKEKIQQIEKDFYRVQTPSLIRNEEFRALIREDVELGFPSSILKWQTKILKGQNPKRMLDRILPIIELLVKEYLRNPNK